MAKNKPYRFVLYLAARFAAFLVQLLPRRTALAFARVAGRWAYSLVGRQRRRTLENLRFAFGSEKSETEILALAPKVFEHAAQTAVEILQFPKLNREKIARFVDVGDTLEVYRSLLGEGKGLISMTAHIGNWELLAGVVLQNGFDAGVVARRIYYEPYNRWLVGLRERLNVRTVYRDDSARELLKILKKNQIVGILPDQDIEGLPGIFVDFFGSPAYTPVAPVKLALASGAPILTSFLIRQPNDRYRFLVGGVIRPEVETTKEAAVAKYTALWMRQFEKIIRDYPEQWGWMHNRWKTRPEDVDAKEATAAGAL